MAPDLAKPLLEKQTPAARALLKALRRLVREVIPQATERVYMGWEVIQYGTTDNMREFIAALAPRPAYVNLELGDGALLPDPAHRLEGTGKRIRHVKIRSAADVSDPAVQALLEAAARRRGLEPRGSALGPGATPAAPARPAALRPRRLEQRR